ncbi:N-acetyltransferase [Corynebacterium sp.]|uniref:GNAT family N-acetyltransferase n=1 Tax=Corynebacterium sp. TaxID=1720 RepID=UPI0026DD3844|nr:GNAT family N-acetyltransferase [Corynebacterium sp.]MDO4609113.1 GNAT family N-acetyltransferase [Corynebacterium sp.]
MQYDVMPMPPEMFRARCAEAVDLYISAMGYDPSLAPGRVRAWLRQMEQPRWAAACIVAHDGSTPPDRALADPRNPLAGIAFCHRGSPTQWWSRQVRGGMATRRRPLREVHATLSDYVELAEIHVAPGHQGAGLGEELLRTLLEGRRERLVLLSTPEVPREANRAWRLYRRLGFADVLRGFLFPGDSRPFAILGAPLPLPPRGGRRHVEDGDVRESRDA